MANKLVVPVNASGKYVLSGVSSANILKIDIVDVDIVVRTKNGDIFVLPGAGIGSMSDEPPSVVFTDKEIYADVLLQSLGTSLRVADEASALTSADSSSQGNGSDQKEDVQKAVDKAVQKALKQAKAEFEKQLEEAHKEDKKHDQQHDQVAALPVNAEASVEATIEKAQKVVENLNTSNYDYVPPYEFKPPPGASASPPGQPAPLSLTPVVTLFMGNVVGTTYDTVTASPTTIVYGGGGAVGSEAIAQIGPRNVQQFSAASIAGTGGNDLIYAQGPALGNANPAVDATMYSKQFNLNVAGYFITLNDIAFSGVPASVTIVGATDNGGGSWTLPASYVTSNQSFEMIYDTAATGTFDITVAVTGDTTRGSTFNSQQIFRFQYLAVTDVNQITDQTLVYESNGRLREIYILPTMDQPNLITAGAGNDSIYGGRSNDTITGGDGNNVVVAKEGNDTVSLGNGNNNLNLGDGNNIATTGSGNDTMVATDGDNVIDAGNGTNTLTLGDGANTITTGTGDDVLSLGDGANTITDTSGNNTITAGDGANSVSLSDGNNTISLGDGGNQLTVGTGTNSITLGSGADSITAGNGTNTIVDAGGASVITTGSGDDSISLGDGNSTIAGGDGNNSITGGIGLAIITTGSGDDTITLASGGGTINAGAGINTINVGAGDYSFTTGSGADTIVAGIGNHTVIGGDGNNSITLGAGTNSITVGSGNDTLVGASGNDFFSAGLGTNSITGNGGTDTLDYSAVTTTGITLSLVGGTATGTGLSDTISGITNVTGTGLADTITGSASSNLIYGGDGNDSIVGNGGNDSLYGGSGNDTLTGNTGNDLIYGGDGNNTISGGAGGTDSLYGGSGNDTFTSNVAGTIYNGTNGAVLAVGEQNTVDYSTASVGMNINLSIGFGTGGAANGSVYALTPTAGVNSINRVIGGTGSDVITGSNADDYLSGGTGFFDTLTGGLGNNTLEGGGGNIELYVMGLGNDTIIANTGSNDRVTYQGSGAGLVINLTNSAQSFVNSLGVTRTVAAYSGGNFGVTAADANSWSVGDYYTPVSGTLTSIERIDGSNASDIIFVGSDNIAYYNYGGNDSIYGGSGGVSFLGFEAKEFFYGGSGGDSFFFSNGADRADGGAGYNLIQTASFYAGPFNTVVYLDASADTNSNGIADSIDRGVGSLVEGGVTYTGFEYGWNNTTAGTNATWIRNFDNILGTARNDYFVGNDNANEINAVGGFNTIFGRGGSDIITAIDGSNTIDGGGGTDIVNFQFTNNSISGAIAQGSGNYTDGVQVFFSDGTFLGASDKAVSWGAGVSTSSQARTGPIGAYLYSSITNVENINGSDSNDVLYGNNSANIIYGNNGVDIIAGNGGADSLYGGAGNDTFRVLATDLASVSIFDGGSGTDTLFAPGWSSIAAGSINSSNSKYVGIETIDVRDSVAGGSYQLSFADVQAFADNGNASTVTFNLDTGDTFTASSAGANNVVTSGSGNNLTYRYYSDFGTTNLIATLNVNYGP